MQHFRESIMSLKKCDVFVDKRRKSDLHFLDLFPNIALAGQVRVILNFQKSKA